MMNMTFFFGFRRSPRVVSQSPIIIGAVALRSDQRGLLTLDHGEDNQTRRRSSSVSMRPQVPNAYSTLFG